MSGIEARPDAVVPSQGIVGPVHDRGQQRRQRPFPKLDPEEERPETDSTPPADVHAPASVPKSRDDFKIDIHVLGSSLPTRQKLPSLVAPTTLH